MRCSLKNGVPRTLTLMLMLMLLAALIAGCGEEKAELGEGGSVATQGLR